MESDKKVKGNLMIEKALIIDEPWISKILSGEKTWEMRSSGCSIRGEIGLIRKGSGQVVGTAVLEVVSGPYDDHGLASNFDKHYVGSEIISKPGYKWRYAWHLKSARELEVPVSYVHKSGAVIWVSLDDAAANKLNAVQLSAKNNSSEMEINMEDCTTLEQTGSLDSVTIKLTQGNINHNHIYLSKVLDFFPKESVGGANSNALASEMLSIDAGLGELTETDIAGDKKIFRNRGLVRSFIQRNKLKAGDEVLITKTGKSD